MVNSAYIAYWYHVCNDEVYSAKEIAAMLVPVALVIPTCYFAHKRVTLLRQGNVEGSRKELNKLIGCAVVIACSVLIFNSIFQDRNTFEHSTAFQEGNAYEINAKRNLYFSQINPLMKIAIRVTSWMLGCNPINWT